MSATTTVRAYPDPRAATPLARRPRSLTADAVRRYRRNRIAVAGALLLAAMVVLAVVGPLLAPYDPTAMFFDARLQPPSARFPLGTDNLGRDILSRMLWGARISLPVGLIAVGIALLIGVPLGLVAGYFGGLPDALLGRAMDVILAFPGILFAIWLVSMLGPNLENVMVAVGLFSVPGFMRVVRGSTLSVKALDYITAERALGARTPRILFAHILPNVAAPVIILASLRVASAILAAAGLSFLGLGAQPPTPEWGAMLSEGRQYLFNAWWVTFWPGLAIALTVLAGNLVGDGLRDALDPRFRDRNN